MQLPNNDVDFIKYNLIVNDDFSLNFKIKYAASISTKIQNTFRDDTYLHTLGIEILTLRVFFTKKILTKLI